MAVGGYGTHFTDQKAFDHIQCCSYACERRDGRCQDVIGCDHAPPLPSLPSALRTEVAGGLGAVADTALAQARKSARDDAVNGCEKGRQPQLALGWICSDPVGTRIVTLRSPNSACTLLNAQSHKTLSHMSMLAIENGEKQCILSFCHCVGNVYCHRVS